MTLLVSGDDDAPLTIHQDVKIFAGKLSQDAKLNHPIHNQAYVLVSQGEINIEGQQLKKSDGAEIIGQDLFALEAESDSEILVIDVPKH